MKRGEVYYAHLSPVVGCEQGGTRPVVIIQNDTGNTYAPSVIVAPMTTAFKKRMPTHVRAGKKDHLDPNTTILMEQIRTIDKSRIGKFVCCLHKETMEKLDEAIEISLGLKVEVVPEFVERRGQDMNDLQTFDNKELELQVRTILNDDGSISVNAEDTARGFGWTTVAKSGNEVVRWARVNEYCKEIGFSLQVEKDDYIPESLFYRLGMKANNSVADRFQNWLAMEVIPSIRKTGGYQKKKMTPEEMMRIQLGMIDGHEERISRSEERLIKLERTMNIDYGQQRILEKEVAKVVIKSLGGKDSAAYKEMSKKVFSECNHDLKDYFHVNSRNNIPRVRFDDAVEYIQNWKPCTNTRVAIKEYE